MIWREKRVLLIVLGLLLAANTIFFFTYRVQYQNRLDALDARLEAETNELQQARATRVGAERQYQSYRQIERDLARVYDEYWSTQAARLTPMITEVKRLAVASSLVPRSYAFDRAEVTTQTTTPSRATAAPASGTTVRRMPEVGATEVGIGFAVEGTYEQVRRLINLLELSNQFVIVDSISLSSREGNKLSLNLHIKTLFRDTTVRPGVNKRL